MPKTRRPAEGAAFIVPNTKAELMAAINQAGIADLKCESSFDDGVLLFSLSVLTKDDRQFYFCQEVTLAPRLHPMEVHDFTEEDGRMVDAHLGTQFDPSQRWKRKKK
jgi:hypothetical protein